MRTAYRTLSLVICGLVMIQAAGHAWFSAGAAKFLEEGGTLDLTATEGPLPFVEIWGIIIHSISGMYVIPTVAVILAIVGYLSRISGAFGYGLTVVGLVALQVALGLTAPSLPFLALLHGLNALLIFGTALLAFYHARPREAREAPVSQEETPRINRRRGIRNRSRTVGSGDVVGAGA